MGYVPYLIFLELIMKKLCFLFAFVLSLGLVSCRNYDTRDGEYDRYNNDRAGFTTRIENGARRAERGIERGFNRTENAFDNAMGNDITGNGVNNY